MAEVYVKIAKNCLKKGGDPCKAILAYRATPLSNGFSPAELLMGRRIRATLPVTSKLLEPKLIDDKKLSREEFMGKQRQEFYFNRRHNARDLETLTPGTPVWIRDQRTYGEVTQKLSQPRSYMVKTPKGTIRRNRVNLIPSFQKQLIIQEEIPSNEYSTANKLEIGSSSNDQTATSNQDQKSSTWGDQEESSISENEVAQTNPEEHRSQNASQGVSQPYVTRYGRQVKPKKTFDI